MSPEQDLLKNVYFEEFMKDFRIIIEGVQKSNEVIELVASSQFKDEDLRERIENLEKNTTKIENCEQRLKILDIEVKNSSNVTENLKKELAKNHKETREVQKIFKDKIIGFQHKAKQQFEQNQALENNIRKAVEETAKTQNEKINKLCLKLKTFEEIKDLGYKNTLEKFFNEIYTRRNNIEQEEIRKKKIYEQIEKKRAKDEECERKRIQDEEAAKIHPKRSKLYEGKVELMVLKNRIHYFFPIFQTHGHFSGNLNECEERIKQISVTNDGRYLFCCILYSDCIENQRN